MGTKGDPGTMGARGSTGAAGMVGPRGESITLSDRAQIGLRISPVQLVNTATATQEELEAIGLGSYIVNAVAACNDCHAHILPPPMAPQFLAGGQSFVIPLGPTQTATIHPRNLTPDPTTGLPHDIQNVDQFVTTFRTGKDPRMGHSNETLQVMPWATFRWMRERDIRAIYAYLTHIPAVSNQVMDDMGRPAVPPATMPPSSYDEGDVTRTLPPADAPDPGDFSLGLTVSPLAEPSNFKMLPADVQGLYARGSYLVNAVAGCSDCHTNPARNYMPGMNYLKINTAQYLTGGLVFTVPPGLNTMTGTRRTMSADLTGNNHGFSDGFEVFMAMLTQGKHVEDNPPHPLAFPMPWQHFRYMDIADLEAIYTYITTVPRRSDLVGVTNDKITQPPTLYCDANVGCPNGMMCFTPSHDGGPGGECWGSTCATAADCGACQSCTALGCTPPAASDTCLSRGI
jgi:hypothetical protein